MMSVVIYPGDCLTTLKTLPDKVFNCCVTSPPYFGLRDYGHEEQIGLEETPDEYVAKLVEVFHEVYRVLMDNGTLWLNLGDSYTSGRRTWRASDNKDSKNCREMSKRCPTLVGLKPKDLIGIPWMVAFALRADGWYLRQDIIWAKPNPMPESVTDRCTKSHEHIFFFSKSKEYYFDNEAIKEPVAPSSIARLSQKNLPNQKGSYRVPGKTNGPMKAVGNKTLRNKRDVWNIVTLPFKGAHFATFPPDLVKPCLLAGCPKDGVVLDPFGGAGTTGLVAKRLGRKAFLCELNPEYVEIAKKRIESDIIESPEP